VKVSTPEKKSHFFNPSEPQTLRIPPSRKTFTPALYIEARSLSARHCPSSSRSTGVTAPGARVASPTARSRPNAPHTRGRGTFWGNPLFPSDSALRIASQKAVHDSGFLTHLPPRPPVPRRRSRGAMGHSGTIDILLHCSLAQRARRQSCQKCSRMFKSVQSRAPGICRAIPPCGSRVNKVVRASG
jgi:hypothetical protein